MEDESGLVCAYVLDGRGGGQITDWTGIADWRPEDGVLWVHLDRSVHDARHWLRQSSGLDPAVVSALLAKEVRPRSVSVTDGLLVVLRGVNLNPGQSPEDMVAIRMWAEADRVITLRRRKLVAVTDLRASIEAGEGPRDAGEILTRLANLLVDNMEPVLGGFEEDIDRLERDIREDSKAPLRPPGRRKDLADLQRTAISLHQYLAPQQEALERFEDNDFGWIEDLHRMSLRENADRVTRYLETLDAERERASVLHDQISDNLAERMNRTVYVLSLIAAIFLPLDFLTGLLGVNVAGIPWADQPWSFAAMLIFLLIVALVILRTFRRLKWL